MCITFTKPSSFGLCTRLHRCSSILFISSKQLRRSVEFRYGSKTALTRTRRRGRTTKPTTIAIRTTRIADRRVKPTNDVIATNVIAIIFKEIGNTRVPPTGISFWFSRIFERKHIFSDSYYSVRNAFVSGCDKNRFRINQLFALFDASLLPSSHRSPISVNLRTQITHCQPIVIATAFNENAQSTQIENLPYNVSLPLIPN